MGMEIICNSEINLDSIEFKTCGDLGVNISNKILNNTSSIKTVNEFNDIVHTELIDVKSRKTISTYPLIKLVYDRYINSFNSNTPSSAYGYFEMNKFIKLVGDYWVDLIEQVIPSTTMWGSVYKHKNTIFDTQKFKYKKYTLKTCTKPSQIEYPSPTNGINGNVGVDILNLMTVKDLENDCIEPPKDVTKCGVLYIEQINDGSEFIGSVSSIKTPETGDTTEPDCDLEVGIEVDKSNEDKNKVKLKPTIKGGDIDEIDNYSWEYKDPETGVVIVIDGENNININYGGTKGMGMVEFKLTIEDNKECSSTKCIGIMIKPGEGGFNIIENECEGED